MLKYAQIKGFIAEGEIEQHIYKWTERTSSCARIVLIRAYECSPAECFCGTHSEITNTFEYWVAPDMSEVKQIVGELKWVSLNKFRGFQHSHEKEG